MGFFMEIIEFLREFNGWTVAIRLLLAVLFGGIIGLERGRQRRAAGLRTHILVCLGAALITAVGFYASTVLDSLGDPLRAAAQVISGIGFLGVGTILVKGRFQITGLTTAAGLWVTAAIGISLGAGFYEGAVIAFFVTVISIMLLHRLERLINNRHSSFGIYVEINGPEHIRECINYLEEHFNAHDIQVTVSRSGLAGNIGIESSISRPSAQKPLSIREVVAEMESLEYVVFSIESV